MPGQSPICFFVSDLHGRPGRYPSLWERILAERPRAVFLGGDLLPTVWDHSWCREGSSGDFLDDVVFPALAELRTALGDQYPRVFAIPGNDDPRCEEDSFTEGEDRGLWEYMHLRCADLDGRPVLGYACVPPTPFLLKDWERYDVSRFVDPGCVSPEEGKRTVPAAEHEVRYGTIAEDLAVLAGDLDLRKGICLFHTPPYRTVLDRAALDGTFVDHVPLDVNVGSIAVQRFLEARQPAVSLHGHIHEAARLTGAWRQQLGRTWCLGAAHDGPELVLVRFDPAAPAAATRELIPPASA
jgi:Icc-related predicted phosphoesterase